MTAPVQMQPDAKGDRLAMTSPVTTQTTGAGRLVVAFMMPSAYSVTDLPRPNDSRVSFRQVPPRRLAVVRFSGGWSEERFKDKETALLSWAVDRKWRTLGRPFSARYNPPFWPTFLRRNEIQVEVQAPEFPPSLPKRWVQD
jgi:hypothetical protein